MQILGGETQIIPGNAHDTDYSIKRARQSHGWCRFLFVPFKVFLSLSRAATAPLSHFQSLPSCDCVPDRLSASHTIEF
jgi:hypothetical protein